MRIILSFKYAFQGIWAGLEEHNMKIHLIIAVLVILGGLYFQISHLEWLAIVVCVGLVITTELVNTALEEFVDLLTAVHPTVYDKAGRPKDIAAGAVLIAALTAGCVGILVFGPYILNLF